MTERWEDEGEMGFTVLRPSAKHYLFAPMGRRGAAVGPPRGRRGAAEGPPRGRRGAAVGSRWAPWAPMRPHGAP